jgi:hypothetical protein
LSGTAAEPGGTDLDTGVMPARTKPRAALKRDHVPRNYTVVVDCDGAFARTSNLP